MAGFVASNVLRGDVEMVTWDQIAGLDPDHFYVLDVRTSSEYNAGHIPGSVHVPVDDLRQRLSELPRDQRPVVLCLAGLRAYIACRILAQNGFQPLDVTGGWETYHDAVFAPQPA